MTASRYSRRLSACSFLLTVALTLAQGQAPSGAAKDSNIKIAGPGLTYLRYPLQVKADGGYVHYHQFGKPLKAPRTVKSISNWEKEVDENAVVIGFIKIEKAGSYGFRTDSYYDRNELILDGNIVCKYGDGANKGQTVNLRAGLIPIVSVGYGTNPTVVKVQWLPPGEAQWADIPNKLLWHEKAD
jgi:hypothetical protein